MLYDQTGTICLAELRDVAPEAALTFAGSGLWVLLVSSGQCRFAGNPPQQAGAGTLALWGGPAQLTPIGGCHILAARLDGRAPGDFLAGLPAGIFLARGESCPGAAELLRQLADAPVQHSTKLQSQVAFSLLCELADADAAAPVLPGLVESAVADIRQNYAGLYGVEELSERLGVSKSHLVRAFHAAMGVSPGKYLTSVRVEAAKRLLAHREYNLDVIASLCGFSGANYLCRVFRRETGVSPAAWRAAAIAAQRGGRAAVQTALEKELYV
ncbi:MAG: helix-turn-helix domain-containing protein [Faecalibacterium sp.]|nr:helix-turn-helix domain-containing protein [Faecalibacterium sp.]